MYRDIWTKCHHSVAAINLIDENGIEIGYFSGFKISRYLITDAGFQELNRAQVAVIKFLSEDGFTVKTSKKFPHSELLNRIVNQHDKTADQFAVIDIDFEEFDQIRPLYIEFKQQPKIGMGLALLAYQFDQPNLTIKSGVLSSVLHFPEERKYLQFDGVIKKGNAGGPLIDITTGNVVGIIGYKLSKAMKRYNQLKSIINSNIDLLKKAEGEFNISEVDPVQVLIVNQNQIKQLAGEIYKSAYMSSSYALSSWNIYNFFERNRIDISPQKDALFNAR